MGLTPPPSNQNQIKPPSNNATTLKQRHHHQTKTKTTLKKKKTIKPNDQPIKKKITIRAIGAPIQTHQSHHQQTHSKKKSLANPALTLIQT